MISDGDTNMSPTDHAVVTFSRGYGNSDNTPRQLAMDSFAAFRDAIDQDRATRKGEQWISAPFGIAPDDAFHQAERSKAEAIGRPHRCSNCVQARRWLGLDIDAGRDDRPALDAAAFSYLAQVLQAYSGIMYTTASHTQDVPRCRIVLELDLPLPRKDSILASAAVRARLDQAMMDSGFPPLPWDPSCDRPEQPLYLPMVGAQTYYFDGIPAASGDLLADSYLIEAAPELPSSLPTADRADPYALSALDQVLRSIASAPAGTRNEILNRESFALGGFIGQGRLNRVLVEATLVHATATAGWDDPDKNAATIRGAISAGILEPRQDGAPRQLQMTMGTAQGADKLKPVDIRDLHKAEITKPEFVFYPIVPIGVVTLLGGHGGAGKSTVALTMCAHAACGRSWAGFACYTPRPVVFVSLEDDGEVVRYRLRTIIEQYGLDPNFVERNLLVLDGANVDAALVREFVLAGNRGIKPTDRLFELQIAVKGAGLIVIDNASDAFDADENNRRQVRSFIRPLAQMARDNHAGVVLLAHIDKNAALHGSRGNSYSGSTAWHNSARSRLALLPDGDYVELRHEKANYSRLAGTVHLGWKAQGVLIPVAMEAVGEEAAAEMVKGDAEAMLKLIVLASEGGLAVPAASRGPSTTRHALETLPEFPAIYKSKIGRRRVEAAVVQLIRDNCVAKVEAKTSSRNVREVLELTPLGWELAQAARASNPHTPSVTDARAGELASDAAVEKEQPTDETHATDADPYRLEFRRVSPVAGRCLGD